ncbi:MAG: D-alanine--D-alanine ligase [Saprospiraceae bacterium]|nr:D-alanine--D-alanine ligase [Saprospiraceae bacterium]
MIRIGIFFGGPSREREISFAGGRTVYDNLNKSLFEPVPIFIDGQGHFIRLDWQYIYKGTIRDFYPPVAALPPSPNNFQIYSESLGTLSEAEWDALIEKVGKRIQPNELPKIMDFAFLALHGEFGEDGQIQGLMESLKIPYSGSGIRACSIGMDKVFQKRLMSAGGFDSPEVFQITRAEWKNGAVDAFFERAGNEIGWPLVIRPANQGSSIGVAILEKDDITSFEKAINRAFFIETITADFWKNLDQNEKVGYLRGLTDIRDGLGFPLTNGQHTFFHPEELLLSLDEHFSKKEDAVLLEGFLSEQRVLLESFIQGKEFSCIVVRLEDGSVTALPPTEIVKGKELFDYRSKYMPGLSRKVTPIELPDDAIQSIRKECVRLFDYLEFNTYARIDGFYAENGKIFLNDPNTTSGMLPSSFFFHQAAEIGLNPSQFLTYIIRTSLWERINTSMSFRIRWEQTLSTLDNALMALRQNKLNRKKIAVIMGGYSFERHISVESGRNIFEKLASSSKYEPIPVFLSKKGDGHELYQMPINLLLKDNADDIRDKILGFKHHPIVEDIKEACTQLTEKYASNDVVFEPQLLSYQDLAEKVDGVFIALHGRPGEDGEVQARLEEVGLPYNGSNQDASQITINKFETLKILRAHGFPTANQILVDKDKFQTNGNTCLDEIESAIAYPLIAKPVDDGCSSAVKMIKNREQLAAFLRLIFRVDDVTEEQDRAILSLHPKEEFPAKEAALIESLITANGAMKFLEITGGMLTHIDENREITYEVFEPSEALASGEVLSLEEKFLAGEGQNLTPSRFSDNTADYTYIAAQVKGDLEKAARILGVTGYCRIDAFVRIFPDNKAETIIIEVNSLPGMTPATCIYHQAAINGYKPYQFIDQILEFGFRDKTTNIRVG